HTAPNYDQGALRADSGAVVVGFRELLRWRRDAPRGRAGKADSVFFRRFESGAMAAVEGTARAAASAEPGPEGSERRTSARRIRTPDTRAARCLSGSEPQISPTILAHLARSVPPCSLCPQ